MNAKQTKGFLKILIHPLQIQIPWFFIETIKLDSIE